MSLRGYCRTFNVFTACNPAMRMTKLTTIASTGRLMKRSVNAVIAFATRHSERSEAESKNPAALPNRDSSGSLDFARDDGESDLFRISTFALRTFLLSIWRFRIQFRFGREIVVHRHSRSVAQLKDSGAHNCLACFQSLRDRDEIATCFADPRKLLQFSACRMLDDG